MTTGAQDLRAVAQRGTVHFMGVGGAGMCALAELLHREGLPVSGCDAKDSESMEALRKLGVPLSVGHDPSHVEDAAAVVVSSAIPDDHPELGRARARGLPVLKRARALGDWVNRGRVLAVAGTHGKTTTTAMATQILEVAGLDPTGFVGGRVATWGGNLRFGSSDLYVVEADEFDRSFHALAPDVAVVTNVEADHLDVYGDLDGVLEAFRTFLRGVRGGGRVAACADDHGASSLLADTSDAGYTYGLSAGSRLRGVDVRRVGAGTHCRVFEDGRDVGGLTLAVAGLHNLRNALGAAAGARALGADWDSIRTALAAFRGVGRRFERVGEVGGVTVIDDYAHHPTELRATLEAARAAYPGRRLIAAFQPHLYSRTRDFHEEFGEALALADGAWVTAVFPAREAPLPGVTGGLVSEAARRAGLAEVHDHVDVETLPVALAEALQPGDVLVSMGAGSIERCGAAVVTLLEARNA